MAVREISRRGHYARHADEIRRRSDGHWAHVQRGAAEGHSFSRAAYSLACAGGNAGFAAPRKIVDAAARSYSLAFDGGRARIARRRDLRADENRSVVHSPTGRVERDEPARCRRNRRDGLEGIAARSETPRNQRRILVADLEDDSRGGAFATRAVR